MARPKSLLVSNSDRKLNYNFIDKKAHEEETVKVTAENRDDILEELLILEKRSKRYPLRNEKEYVMGQPLADKDPEVFEKICGYGGKLNYHVLSTVSVKEFDLLVLNPSNEVIYPLKDEYTDEELRNIKETSKGVKTSILAPIVVPDVNPHKVLISLNGLKADIDNVYITFPPLEAEHYAEDKHSKYYSNYGDSYYCHFDTKFLYVEILRNSLSFWKQNIVVETTSKKDKEKWLEATRNLTSTR